MSGQADVARGATGTVFRTDIQGMRAIAVLLVVVFHAGVSALPGGFVGVDVFFVISGYLITGQILGSMDKGPFRFASFYAKRARRILPASLLVVVLTLIGAVIWLPPLQLPQVFAGALATALYVPNMYFAVRGTDYFASESISLFQHYWSLGVEEQFYLIWPALLVVAFVLVRRSERRLFWFLVAVVVVSFFAGWVTTYVSQPWAFFSLPTRAWELGVGGLVQFALRRGVGLPPVVGRIAAWAGIAVLAAAALLITETTPFPGVAALVPVAGSAALIFGGALARDNLVSRALGTRPMVFIGTISYSMYLVHWPLLILPRQALGDEPLPLWATLLLGALSVPLAWLMYRFVETPMRHLPALERRRPRATLGWTGVVTVAIAVVCVFGVVAVRFLPLSSPQAAASTTVSTSVDSTPFVPNNLTPSLRSAEDDKASIYKGGCADDAFVAYRCDRGDPAGARTIALFGDSHAAQWFPALDTITSEAGDRLLVRVKNACPAAAVEVLFNGVPNPVCDAWRAAIMKEFAADPPDVIVISNLAQSRPEEPVPLDQWESGLQETIRELSAHSEVIMLADTPRMQQYPPYCLSGHLDSALACGVARDAALNAAGADIEARVASEFGVKYVNLNDYLCSADFCPAIIGNTLVYRDSHHLTASMAEELAPELARTAF